MKALIDSLRQISRLPALFRCGFWIGLGSLGTWCVLAFAAAGQGTYCQVRLSRISEETPVSVSVHPGVTKLTGTNPSLDRLISRLRSSRNKIQHFINTAAWSETASADALFPEVTNTNLRTNIIQCLINTRPEQIRTFIALNKDEKERAAEIS